VFSVFSVVNYLFLLSLEAAHPTMPPPEVVVPLDGMAARRDNSGTADVSPIMPDEFFARDAGGRSSGRGAVGGRESQATESGANDKRESGDESGHAMTSSLNGVGKAGR
jgi:hypothetical protein